MKTTFTGFLLIVLLLAIGFNDTTAQQPDPGTPVPENLSVPAEWEVRLDNPNDEVTIGADKENSDIYFVNMTPGWHITTGPRAIFWHPASSASGSYRVHSKIHLFDPKGRNEAFGIFMGGANLKQQSQTYTYFLLRNSGEYLIKKRVASDTEIVKNWTQTTTMNQYNEDTESSVANTLSVEVDGSEARFYVNGTLVDTLPTEELDTAGYAGLRVNHRLDLHIEDFGIEEL
jgi:hypothetical protein